MPKFLTINFIFHKEEDVESQTFLRMETYIPLLFTKSHMGNTLMVQKFCLHVTLLLEWAFVVVSAKMGIGLKLLL